MGHRSDRRIEALRLPDHVGSVGRLRRHIKDGSSTEVSVEINEFQRFSACMLGLMNADLAARSAADVRNACVLERDKLRRSLAKAGLELKPSCSSVLCVEDYQQLLAVACVGDLEQTLALLVELCASRPWAAVEDGPALDRRVREGFLGRLAVDLPGNSDEDDIEYIDAFLKEGRKAGWSPGRILLVVGGAVAVGVLTAGIGAALIAGGGAVAAGGAVVGAAVIGATTAEVAAAAAATVLVGAGGGFGARVLTSEMSPDLVDAAVLKRYTLVRILLTYPDQAANAARQFGELKRAHAGLKAKRAGTTDREPDKELDRKIESFERAIERLEGHIA
jgi:hypothetical protein